MENDFVLTHEQQATYDLVEHSNSNILIHGKPGVGKSVVTRALRATGTKHYALAAPTGLAALNIGGKTLHSLFGIQPSEGAYAPDFNIFTKNDFVLKNVYYRVQHLIIDEISMVRADMLDYIDRFLQDVKGSSEPFGGVQVIAVGDFFQLPPIVRTSEEKQLKEYGYKSEFAFDARCFQGFKLLSLNKILRQSDSKFINILHAARTGNVTAPMLKTLNKLVGSCDDFRIQLTSTNAQADLINTKQLSLLKTPPMKFIAEKIGYWPQNPVEQTIVLKVGAQVIIKKNNADRPPGAKGSSSGKIVNGTICKIVKLPTKEHDYTVVELEDGSHHNIYRATWDRKEKERGDNDAWSEKYKASFDQVPFQLAWAISMHKSQGQSFDKVHIDAHKIFAAGQLYVALSRARTLEGISLQVPLMSKSFFTNKNVLRFERNMYEHS